jgi:hypothetical protein
LEKKKYTKHHNQNFYYENEKKKQIKIIASWMKTRLIQIEEYYKNFKNGKVQLKLYEYQIKCYVKEKSINIYLPSSISEDKGKSIKIEIEKLFSRKCYIKFTFNGYIIPEGFYYSQDGIYALKVKKEKNEEGKYEKREYREKITDKHLFIVSNVYSEEYNLHQFEVMSQMSNGTEIKTELCTKDHLYKSNLVISFLASKLNCNCIDEYRKDYNLLFYRFAQENKTNLKLKNTVPTLGWNETLDEYAPYSVKLNIDYSRDTYNYFRTLVRGFLKKGNRNEFIERMQKHAVNPYADFAISAAFASPLLKVVGVRSFLLNYYGNSKSQKSLSARVGLSAFGKKDLLEMSGQDTINVLKSKIHKMQNNFCLIDEIIQKGNRTKIPVINGYDIGNERDRHRMDVNAEIKGTKTWRTIVFCTSEQPISNDNDMAGEINRTLVLEANCCPLDLKENEVDKYARNYYSFLDSNYGLLGEEYINQIIKIGPELKKIYNIIDDKLSLETNQENLTDHITSIAIICLGNYLYRNIFFKENSLKSSIDLGIMILKSIDTIKELDPLQKCLDDIYTFYEINSSSFQTELNEAQKGKYTNILGKVKNGQIYFIIGPLKKYLEECGWNWNIKRQLESKGLIQYKPKSINNIVGKRIIIPIEREDIINEIDMRIEREGIQNEGKIIDINSKDHLK